MELRTLVALSQDLVPFSEPTWQLTLICTTVTGSMIPSSCYDVLIQYRHTCGTDIDADKILKIIMHLKTSQARGSHGRQTNKKNRVREGGKEEAGVEKAEL